MKTFSQFALESRGMLPRQLGHGLRGNLRYAGLQTPYVPSATKTKTKPKPEKGETKLTDFERELLARIKQHRAQGVHVDDLTSPIDSNYQAKRSKIRKSLESLTKKNLLVKRTYKVTGVDVTKYSLPSSD